MIKFEDNTLTILDGFLIQKQGTVITLKPLSQLGTIYPNSSGIWVSEKITFHDELFRQPNNFRPLCSSLYNSHVPQMHFIAFNYKGGLQVKQSIVDKSSTAKNKFTELSTFAGSRK